MKRTLLVAFGLIFCGSHASSSKILKGELILETRATRTIENNLVKDTPNEKVYNLDNKTPVEKLFFGDSNAPFEFYVAPSFSGSYGLRIFRDPANGFWMLEIKRVLNWQEVESRINEEYPYYQSMLIAKAEGLEGEALRQVTRTVLAKHQEESAKLYEVKTIFFPVNDSLARKLYAKAFIALVTSPAEIKGQGVRDGISVTFRCVVGDQVWTLKYHEPEDDFLKLTDICAQMVNDAEEGTFDAQKYLELLNY